MAAASLGNTDALAGDYRALVCLFLYGGNDANNLLVPAGADYAAYATARGGLALPQANVLPIAPITSDGRSFGLHSSLTELKSLFDQRKMAVIANAGTLVEPLTKAQYLNGSGRRPPQLFSHSDQQVQWQTSVPDVASRTGWGGRTGDLMRALNGSAQVSICVSINGNNTFPGRRKHRALRRFLVRLRRPLELRLSEHRRRHERHHPFARARRSPRARPHEPL